MVGLASLRLHYVMVSENTRSAPLSAAGKRSALRLETERLIPKERLKDAVKQAKLAFKEEGWAIVSRDREDR
jgi:hypothetical protein